jgi:hypothetical protein
MRVQKPLGCSIEIILIGGVGITKAEEPGKMFAKLEVCADTSRDTASISDSLLKMPAKDTPG